MELYLAVATKDVAEVRKRIEAGDHAKWEKKEWDNACALHSACFNGHVEIVRLLLAMETSKIEVDKANNNGATPFFIACQNGHIEVVKTMMADQRVDVSKAKNNGATPFFIACQVGHVEVVKTLLMDARIDTQKSLPDRNWSPLMAASLNGHIDVIKLLLCFGRKIDLEQKSTKNTESTKSGSTAIDIAKDSKEEKMKNENNRKKIIDLLTDNKENKLNLDSLRKEVGIEELSLELRLQFACSDGDLTMVKKLVEQGVSPSWKDRKGNDSIFYANYRNQTHVVAFLKRKVILAVEYQETKVKFENQFASLEELSLQIKKKLNISNNEAITMEYYDSDLQEFLVPEHVNEIPEKGKLRINLAKEKGKPIQSSSPIKTEKSSIIPSGNQDHGHFMETYSSRLLDVEMDMNTNPINGIKEAPDLSFEEAVSRAQQQNPSLQKEDLSANIFASQLFAENKSDPLLTIQRSIH